MRGLCWNHQFRPSCACPWSVMRGLCWNHWFRPSCACVLATLPCRTRGAHRTLWFLLSLRWFALCEFLAEAPGPERLTKFWWRHRAPKDWQNFDEAREFSALNFSRVCVASKICHYSKMPICCKVWFHWFTSRKHMFLLFMHRQLYLFVRRAPVKTIKLSIFTCVIVS